MIRSSPSFSWPIEVQVSVATTSASSTASYRVAQRLHRAAGPRGDLGGPADHGRVRVVPAGPATRTRMPAVAPASRYECAMLLAASPTYASVPPRRAAQPLPDGEQVGEQLAGVEAVGERVDHRHGRCPGASSADPVVGVGADDDRGDVAGQHLRRRRSIVSPRPKWVLCASMTSGWPPSSAMPASNETRVRRRRLLEDDRDRLRAGERLVLVAVGLHPRRPGRAPRPARPG